MSFLLYRVRYFPLELIQQFLSLRLDFQRKRISKGSQISKLARIVESTAQTGSFKWTTQVRISLLKVELC